MSPNVELLARTMGQIIVHPEEWYQDSYRCGSGMCFAGWAVALSGHQYVTEPNHDGSDWVHDAEGTSIWDVRNKRIVEDGQKQLKELLGYLGRFDNDPIPYYDVVEMKRLSTLVVEQRQNPSNFVRVSSIDTVARRELGLTKAQATSLFSGYNRMDHLIDYTGRLSRGESINAYDQRDDS